MEALAAGAMSHDALFYDDERALLETAVEFVRVGVERGEQVLVSTTGNPATPLLRALFADERCVRFSDGSLYERPVDVIGHYRRIMDQGRSQGVPGFRAMGFIDLDASELPWQEWARYEAAVTRLFAGDPFVTLCPWDTRVISPEQLAGLIGSHQGLLGPQRRDDNTAYVEPDELVRHPDLALPEDLLQSAPPVLEMHDVADVRSMRDAVFPCAFETGLSGKTVDGFVRALGELVANGRTHGVPPVALRLWVAPDRLVATVTDTGPGCDDPFLGYLPSHSRRRDGDDATAGVGLWVARMMCSVLDYGPTPEGFTVRVSCFV